MEAKPIIDMSIVNETKRIVGASFAKIVQCFISVSPEYIDEIRQGFKEQNLLKIASGAHTLKSSCIQLGAACLSGKAREIELIAKQEDKIFKEQVNELAPLFSELEELCAATEKELAALILSELI